MAPYCREMAALYHIAPHDYGVPVSGVTSPPVRRDRVATLQEVGEKGEEMKSVNVGGFENDKMIHPVRFPSYVHGDAGVE